MDLHIDGRMVSSYRFMKTVRAVAAFIQKDGKFFAAQRAYGFLKGKWEFPGGKIEEGESPEEAIKREIIEELNTEIDVTGFACNVVHQYPDFILDMEVFFAVIKQGRLDLKEGIHLQERFFSFEECEEEEWSPADWIIINKLRKNRKN